MRQTTKILIGGCASFCMVLLAFAIWLFYISYIPSVFDDKDFELCVLPLPEGYPNSWTHASIEYVKDSVNGFQYFFACSPYPNYDDKYENPMFYYANARKGNRPPIVFIPYDGNPLQETPECGYNSDPDVVYLDSNLYVLNRTYIRHEIESATIQKCNVSDGKFCFSSPILIYDSEQEPKHFGFGDYKPTLISPSIIKYMHGLRCYQLATNSYNDNSECKGVIVMKGNNPISDHGFTVEKIGKIDMPEGAKPWHIDVFNYHGKLFAIICAYIHPNKFILKIPYLRRFYLKERYCTQYLAVSDDGINFKAYDKPLTSINSYRSSAFVREDGLFVLYISTLAYRPKGNVSEDGRNIMVAYKPFCEILNSLKN